jgi:hypothetical protein
MAEDTASPTGEAQDGPQEQALLITEHLEEGYETIAITMKTHEWDELLANLPETTPGTFREDVHIARNPEEGLRGVTFYFRDLKADEVDFTTTAQSDGSTEAVAKWGAYTVTRVFLPGEWKEEDSGQHAASAMERLRQYALQHFDASAELLTGIAMGRHQWRLQGTLPGIPVYAPERAEDETEQEVEDKSE